MTLVHDMIGYAVLSLLAMTAPFAVPGFSWLSYRGRAWAMGLALTLAWTPAWHGHSALFYARGIVGDLSLTSLVAFSLLAARGLGWRSMFTDAMPRDLSALLFFMFITLYLSALGYIHLDLYAWGYQPRAFLAVVGLLLMIAWQRHPGLAVAWLISLAAFALGLLPSPNIWDALGDPILCLGGAWYMCFRPARDRNEENHIPAQLPPAQPRRAA